MPPIYDWLCEKCELEFETVQSMREYDGKANCVQCGNLAIRIYKYCKFHFTGTKIEDAEFNPGLGQITKSKAHRDELAKKMGAVEIGNEKPEAIHSHFDSARETQKKKNWDET